MYFAYQHLSFLSVHNAKYNPTARNVILNAPVSNSITKKNVRQLKNVASGTQQAQWQAFSHLAGITGQANPLDGGKFAGNVLRRMQRWQFNFVLSLAGK